MSDSTAVTASDGTPTKANDPVTLVRRVVLGLFLVACLSVLAAGVVNWFSVRPHADYANGQSGVKVVATRYDPATLHLDEPPVELLPSDILTFETITRHGIPGQEQQAAEAMYKTYDMDLEALVSISVYARVEGMPTAEEAKSRADELLGLYATARSDVLLNNATQAQAGFTADSGAFGVVWTRGQYVTFVKTLYANGNPPAQKTQELLVRQSTPVTRAIDAYQRTGAQGAQLGTKKP